jgi:RNA polymerase-associated protein LEO1
MSDSDEPLNEIPDDEVDDLFGDGGDEDDNEAQFDNERALSDADLASDKDRRERYDDGEDMDMDEQEAEVKDRLIMNIQMYRHRTPKSKDGSVRLRCSATTKVSVF